MHRRISATANRAIAAIFALAFLSGATAQGQRVTDVFLKADDGRVSGGCPIKIVFHGSITTDGPGVVEYTFTRSDGAKGPVYKLEFEKAGSQPVATDWTLGDEQSLPSYSGWQAIKILSPNELESSHDTGAFSIKCTTARATTAELTPNANISGSVKGNPSGPLRSGNDTKSSGGAPSTACYVVTLNGFTVNHMTSDDSLRRDGVGDEVFLNSPTLFRFDRDARVLREEIGGFGNVFGERRSPDEAGRIQAGRATPNGGLQTGDKFPSDTPWRRDSIHGGLAFPYLFYRGSLAPGELLVIVPSLWEWDTTDDSLEDYNVNAFYSRMMRDLRSYVSLMIGREGYDRFVLGDLAAGNVPVIKTFSQLGLERRVSIGLGPFSPGNRPIGMRLQREHTDRPVFDPQVLFLTAEAADYMSRNNAFRLGNGVMPFRYHDDPELEGDYTLYVQTERVECGQEP